MTDEANPRARKGVLKSSRARIEHKDLVEPSASAQLTRNDDGAREKPEGGGCKRVMFAVDATPSLEEVSEDQEPSSPLETSDLDTVSL